MTVMGLLVLVAVTPLGGSPQPTDTLRATREVIQETVRYVQQAVRVDLSARTPIANGARCDADVGDRCVDGPVPYPCRMGKTCVFQSNLPEFVFKKALAHPDAGFIDGFATFLLINSGRQLDAFKVARACTAVGWWCSLLRGYVFNSVGRLSEAEREFRSALAAAPRNVRCAFVDASWSVPERMREFMQRLRCRRRIAVSDSTWWLADPSFASPGNERWTEQVARTIYRRFHTVPDSAFYHGMADWGQDWESSVILPRGQFDSWRKDAAYAGAHHNLLYVWTSRKAARYHFVPDFEGADLSHPVWHLHGTIQQEGYTPPTSAFYEVPAQIARFRHGDSGDSDDSMVVAVAGTLAGTPLASAAAPTAYLILSDGPESFPLRLSSALRDERAVFLGQAAPKPWVTSFEVLSKDGIGRHRVMLEPLRVQGPGLSDVLLYSPVGLDLPDSLRMAAGMMLGDTTVAKGDQLGIYWETYGAPKGAAVSVELQLQREGGGLLSQLKNLVPGLGAGSSGRPGWTETSPGPLFRRAMVLDLSEVDPGSYTLVVKTSWPGQEELQTRRAFVVRNGGDDGS
jgi:hypothetical protein